MRSTALPRNGFTIPRHRDADGLNSVAHLGFPAGIRNPEPLRTPARRFG